MKLYVFDNELLGDDGTEFSAALCDEIEAETEEECFNKFESEFGSNDFLASFSAP
jgi:hypothetical protein